MAIAALSALLWAAAPAAAMPAGKPNAQPKIVAAWAVTGEDGAVEVVIKARDRDDVVRGVEVFWSDADSQGISACERTSRRAERRQRGRTTRFALSHAYPAAGDYTVTVQVLSGGCGKRAQQRSAPHTLTVHIS
jgi:hypothetical protein